VGWVGMCQGAGARGGWFRTPHPPSYFSVAALHSRQLAGPPRPAAAPFPRGAQCSAAASCRAHGHKCRRLSPSTAQHNKGTRGPYITSASFHNPRAQGGLPEGAGAGASTSLAAAAVPAAGGGGRQQGAQEPCRHKSSWCGLTRLPRRGNLAFEAHSTEIALFSGCNSRQSSPIAGAQTSRELTSGTAQQEGNREESSAGQARHCVEKETTK